MPHMFKRIRLTWRDASAGGYGILTFLFAFALAWALMYPADFFYGLWHDHAGIAEGIEKYGPKNRYKPGFADTTRAQRVALFGEINVAVHRGGEGLEAISYQTPSSRGPQLLLRQPEVVHLQDVAHLMQGLMVFASVVAMLWVLATACYVLRRDFIPGMLQQSIGPCLIIVLSGLCLLFFGAENVFNQLHIWVFPLEHQWFFYYQDSLMSTMMLAPRLFAWIAFSWVLLAMVIFVAVIFACERLVQYLAYRRGVKL